MNPHITDNEIRAADDRIMRFGVNTDFAGRKKLANFLHAARLRIDELVKDNEKLRENQQVKIYSPDNDDLRFDAMENQSC